MGDAAPAETAEARTPATTSSAPEVVKVDLAVRHRLAVAQVPGRVALWELE